MTEDRPVVLAVPGDLDQPTGGYRYARRVLAEAKAMDWTLEHLPLPGGFPFPDEAALTETARRLAAVPRESILIVDGLALGALAEQVLAPLDWLVALCHHPLGDETGLGEHDRARLEASERAALACARLVVTTSRTTAERLISGFGVDPEKVAVALPGTDPAPSAKGSGGPGVAILSVGSLVARKGHDVLIEALGQVADLDWTCNIVGDTRDAATAGTLVNMAARFGGRVAFAGAMDRDALEGVYHDADLFALASRHEGFGMVYVEAMAHGLPVIGTTAGAIPEATAGGAMLVAPDDPDALAQALRGMIAHPGTRARWSKKARQAATTLPGWADTVAALREAVEALA